MEAVCTICSAFPTERLGSAISATAVFASTFLMGVDSTNIGSVDRFDIAKSLIMLVGLVKAYDGVP